MFEAHGDEPDKEYPIFCRKEGSLEASEEVILDQNELARSTGYCNLGVVRVSPDHRLLAYSLDLDGSERFTLRVKDLETSMLLPDILAGASDSLEWLDDSRSFVYATLDPSMRPHQAVLHRLEEPPSEDLVPWTERDERFLVGLSKSKSKRYLFVELESKATTAFHCLDLKSSHVSLTVGEPRSQGHEYFVEHHGDSFFVRTNDALSAPTTRLRTSGSCRRRSRRQAGGIGAK